MRDGASSMQPPGLNALGRTKLALTCGNGTESDLRVLKASQLPHRICAAKGSSAAHCTTLHGLALSIL